MKVGILGGGLTGLSLGYFLEKQTIDFEILERDSECGGLCKTVQKDGFTFDCSGGHVIFSRDEEVMNFILALLSENLNRCRRNTKILYNGKYIKYPFENGLSDLPKEERFECVYHFVDALLRRERKELKEPSNFREWMYHSFGKGIAEKYLIPYNEKIWKMDPALLGLDWIKIRDRLPQPNMEDVIKSALDIETEGYLSQLFFYYPLQGGIQSLTNAIENKIKSKVTKGFEVKKVEKNSKWVVSSGSVKKEFDVLVSTIPITDLTGMVEIPHEVRSAADSLKYNSLITVLIGLNTENIPDIHWVYVPDKKITAHRFTFPKNHSPKTVPPGKSSIQVEITCKFEDIFWNREDESIIKEIVEQLDEGGIIDKKTVCFTKVNRAKYAYVVNDMNYSNNVEAVRKFIEGYGIRLCGRFSEFKYLNMDACIRNAIDMSRKIGEAK